MAKNYWLMKSEPDAFSIDQLKKEKVSPWDGIRNYQARNFMMKDMKVGDEILFYHSNCKPPGIIGLAKVASECKVDKTAFDKKSPYFEKRGSKEKPLWHCVDVAFEKKFKRLISLDELRENKKLEDMLILRKGNRLSITPVEKKHFQEVLKML